MNLQQTIDCLSKMPEWKSLSKQLKPNIHIDDAEQLKLFLILYQLQQKPLSTYTENTVQQHEFPDFHAEYKFCYPGPPLKNKLTLTLTAKSNKKRSHTATITIFDKINPTGFLINRLSWFKDTEIQTTFDGLPSTTDKKILNLYLLEDIKQSITAIAALKDTFNQQASKNVNHYTVINSPALIRLMQYNLDILRNLANDNAYFAAATCAHAELIYHIKCNLISNDTSEHLTQINESNAPLICPATSLFEKISIQLRTRICDILFEPIHNILSELQQTLEQTDDTLAQQYLKQTIQLIENNNNENPIALFNELVINHPSSLNPNKLQTATAETIPIIFSQLANEIQARHSYSTISDDSDSNKQADFTTTINAKLNQAMQATNEQITTESKVEVFNSLYEQQLNPFATLFQIKGTKRHILMNFIFWPEQTFGDNWTTNKNTQWLIPWHQHYHALIHQHLTTLSNIEEQQTHATITDIHQQEYCVMFDTKQQAVTFTRATDAYGYTEPSRSISICLDNNIKQISGTCDKIRAKTIKNIEALNLLYSAQQQLLLHILNPIKNMLESLASPGKDITEKWLQWSKKSKTARKKRGRKKKRSYNTPPFPLKSSDPNEKQKLTTIIAAASKIITDSDECDYFIKTQNASVDIYVIPKEVTQNQLKAANCNDHPVTKTALSTTLNLHNLALAIKQLLELKPQIDQADKYRQALLLEETSTSDNSTQNSTQQSTPDSPTQPPKDHSLQTEVKSLKLANKQLLDESQQLQKHSNEQSHQITRLSTENSELQHKLQTQINKNDTHVVEAKIKHQAHHNKLTQLAAHIQKLKAAIASQQKNSRVHSELQKNLQDKIQRQQTRATQAERKNINLTHQVKELQTKIKQLHKTNSEQHKQLDDATEVDALNAQLKQQEKQINQLETTNTKQQKQLNDTTELDALQTQLTEQKANNTTLNNQITALQKTITQLQQQLNQQTALQNEQSCIEDNDDIDDGNWQHTQIDTNTTNINTNRTHIDQLWFQLAHIQHLIAPYAQPACPPMPPHDQNYFPPVSPVRHHPNNLFQQAPAINQSAKNSPHSTATNTTHDENKDNGTVSTNTP
jgi:hypothetical protein